MKEQALSPCRDVYKRQMLGVYYAYGDKKFFDYAVAYADTVFIECELGKQIVSAGWHNWGCLLYTSMKL